MPTKNPKPNRIAVASVAVGVALCLWAWWLDRPPGAVPADAAVERFSAGRALLHLEEVAARPHMPGSAEHTRIRDYLVGELEGAGFEVEVQETTVVSPRGRVLRAVTVRNILARKRGSDSTGGVAVVSHYDSQQLTPAAGDDGAAVAASLEAARALEQGGPLRNDLYLIITDAEELGLMGARGFVDEHPWWPEISVLLNFEARGAAGQSVMIETNAGNGWVVREFARADPYPTGNSLYYEIYKRLPNDTDFSVFKRAGVTGLNFALAESADVYHRTADTIDNLSMASVQHHGEHMLAMARHFGELDLSVATTAPDVVFFRFPALGLVTYPAGWATVLSVLALVFAGVVGVSGFRRGRLGVGGILAGVLMSILAGAGAAGLSWLMWRAVRGAHHELGSIVGRALYNEAWYGLAVGCIAVGVVAATFGVLRRWFGAASLAAGALLIPLVLAVASGWTIPGVSMLFLWPSVFAVAATRHLMSGDEDRLLGGDDLAVFTLLGAPPVLLLFPLAWTLYAGLNIGAAPLIAVVAVVLAILLLPFFELATQSNRWWLASCSLGVAMAFTVVGVIDARPGPGRPIPDDLVYALDRDSNVAVWATTRDQDDGWIEGFVDASSPEGDLAPFLAGNQRAYRLAAAPLLSAPPAEVAVVADVTDGRVRTIRIEIRSAIGPELMNVSPSPGSALTLRAVNGVRVGDDTSESGDWLLQHYGIPPGGALSLDLQTEQTASPVELVLVEFLMRLPPAPGFDTQRPPGVIAHGRLLTDASLFRQVMTFD